MSSSITKFEDLKIWQIGVELTVEIYKVLQNCKDFSLRNQMQGAAVSIPSNIAEGFERKGNKEFIQFLSISRGSTGELRTQVIIAKKLNIIEVTKADSLIETTKILSAMISKLIKIRQKIF